MDRYTNQDGQDFLHVVNCDIDITLGAAGATSGVTPNQSGGILSIVSGGAGVYTVTFQDGYVECLNIIENVIQAAYSAAGAVYMTWTTEYAFAGGAATVVLTARTAAGAAVQPATGDRLKLTFRMQYKPSGG